VINNVDYRYVIFIERNTIFPMVDMSNCSKLLCTCNKNYRIIFC